MLYHIFIRKSIEETMPNLILLRFEKEAFLAKCKNERWIFFFVDMVVCVSRMKRRFQVIDFGVDCTWCDIAAMVHFLSG